MRQRRIEIAYQQGDRKVKESYNDAVRQGNFAIEQSVQFGCVSQDCANDEIQKVKQDFDVVQISDVEGSGIIRIVSTVSGFQ